MGYKKAIWNLKAMQATHYRLAYIRGKVIKHVICVGIFISSVDSKHKHETVKEKNQIWIWSIRRSLIVR